MSITDTLEKNRVWLGFALLSASWLSIVLTPIWRDVIILVSIAIILIGVGRSLSEYKAGRTQPALDTVDKLQLALGLLTLVAAAYLRFGVQDGKALSPEIFSILALVNLPRMRRGTDPSETH